MIDEMVRVTRPGGTVFVSFTPWWSPWGGHETAPWHYLGGEYARRRYRPPDRPRAEEPVRTQPVPHLDRCRPTLGAEHRTSRPRRLPAPVPPVVGPLGRAGPGGP